MSKRKTKSRLPRQIRAICTEANSEREIMDFLRDVVMQLHDDPELVDCEKGYRAWLKDAPPKLCLWRLLRFVARRELEIGEGRQVEPLFDFVELRAAMADLSPRPSGE